MQVVTKRTDYETGLTRLASAETVQICLTSILLNGFALYILRYTHGKFSYADKF